MSFYYTVVGGRRQRCGTFYIPSIAETKKFCKYVQDKLDGRYAVNVITDISARKYIVRFYGMNSACCTDPAYEFEMKFSEERPETALLLANEVLKKDIEKLYRKIDVGCEHNEKSEI